MNTRSLKLYGITMIVGLAAGTAVTYWTTDNDSAIEASRPSATPGQTSTQDRVTGAIPPPTHPPQTPILQMDGSLEATQYAETARARAPTPSSNGMPVSDPGKTSRTLDLTLPDTAETAEPAEASSTPPPKAVFDLDVQPETISHVEAYNLFNPEYGLRGFMKQEWINRNVGLLAGLGLNDERRIQTKTGLQDDVAVGMGVILAF